MAGPKERGTKIPKGFARVFTGLHGLVYRLSKGRLGGKIDGAHMVVLGTTGAKSGTRRMSPLVAIDHFDGWAVVASFSGHDVDPGWCHNLRAHPEATLQIGPDVHQVRAAPVEGEMRSELWDRFKTAYPDYAKYERVTDREFPIFALTPR